MAFKSIISTVFTCAGLLMMSNIKLVSAAPLSYDEAIDGDLYAGLYPDTSKVLELDIGINTVTGSTVVSSFRTDLDSFFIIFPAGSQLISISYEFRNLDLIPDTSFLIKRFQFFNYYKSTNELWTIDLINDTSPLSAFSSSLPVPSLPIEEDIYKLKNEGYAYTSLGGGSWDYTWTFEVTTVPIPATVWLFGSGIIGLIGIARRKKS